MKDDDDDRRKADKNKHRKPPPDDTIEQTVSFYRTGDPVYNLGTMMVSSLQSSPENSRPHDVGAKSESSEELEEARPCKSWAPTTQASRSGTIEKVQDLFRRRSETHEDRRYEHRWLRCCGCRIWRSGMQVCRCGHE